MFAEWSQIHSRLAVPPICRDTQKRIECFGAPSFGFGFSESKPQISTAKPDFTELCTSVQQRRSASIKKSLNQSVIQPDFRDDF